MSKDQWLFLCKSERHTRTHDLIPVWAQPRQARVRIHIYMFEAGDQIIIAFIVFAEPGTK